MVIITPTDSGIETIKPTTHSEPVYIVDGIVHYGVANMPGAVPYTSTVALTNATLPYVLEIANKGFKDVVQPNKEICLGVNVYKGFITNKGVASAFDFPYIPINEAMTQDVST